MNEALLTKRQQSRSGSSGDKPYTLGAGILAISLCLPVISLFVIAFSGDFDSFRHIATTIMPTAIRTTFLLLLGVGVLVAFVGTLTAWLITFYRFPFRDLLQWLLMLPLAVPTYISAYAFVEFFSYTGPLQSLVRSIGGYSSSREYYFPEIRSLEGTALVMGVVLYPYVYLAVRMLLQFQGRNVLDTARVLGASGGRLLFKVTLPMVRPAIILGVTLALMETINDIGAVEHMGTQTLTFSIFSVWLNQSDLAGAAQIALFLLIIVGFLIAVERYSRGGRRFHEAKAHKPGLGISRAKLTGARAGFATTACLTPVLLGFGIPIYVLGGYAFTKFDPTDLAELAEPFATSFVLGLGAALIAVIVALFLTYSLRVKYSRRLAILVRLASSGYAVPGTLIALGIFLPLSMFDNALDSVMRSTFGISTGLLITGSGAALILAYVIRFMAMAEGNLSNGFSKLSPNMDMAARSLGRTRSQVLRTILLPIMRPAIIGAGLLVFVEVVKELSATIMLRPFGMETLALHVYDYASQARVENAALGCLLIIAVGAIPVILLLRTNSN